MLQGSRDVEGEGVEVDITKTVYVYEFFNEKNDNKIDKVYFDLLSGRVSLWLVSPNFLELQ